MNRAYMRSLMVALIALTTLAFASAPAAMANEAKPAAHAAAVRHEAHKRAEHKEMRRHHVKKTPHDASHEETQKTY